MSLHHESHGDTTALAWLFGAVLGIGALLGLFLVARTSDSGMAFHGWVFIAFCLIGIFVLVKRRLDDAGRIPLEERQSGEIAYNDEVVKAGAIASTFWGVIGFLVGLVIALQLAFPVLNFDLPWTNFGRLRPLHTSAVIFAFGGNVLIATSFYVVQRTCRARLAGVYAPWFVFWGYQLFIVLAATG